VQVEWVAFCWFLLCGGDCRSSCWVYWSSYWLYSFERLAECSLVVKVRIHPTHRSVVDEVNEALPYSGQHNDGKGATWKRQVDKAENEKSVLCKHLDGKPLFTGMLRLYTEIHRDWGQSPAGVCARKRGGSAPQQASKEKSDSDEGSSTSKWEVTEKCRPLLVHQKPRSVATNNFFAPLRAVPMLGAEVCDETPFLDNNLEKGRPPP
jgi:hypothetical protein